MESIKDVPLLNVYQLHVEELLLQNRLNTFDHANYSYTR